MFAKTTTATTKNVSKGTMEQSDPKFIWLQRYGTLQVVTIWI